MRESYRKRSNGDTKYAYSRTFLDLLKRRPDILSTFISAIAELSKKGDMVEIPDGIITLIDIKHPVNIPGRELSPTKFYKVSLPEGDFFVKSAGSGFSEMEDTLSAKEKLIGIEGVRIIDPVYSYSSQNQDYFVTDWLEYPVIQDLVDQISPTKYEELEARLANVRDVLGSGYFDVNTRNAFYDKNTDTVILFDLNEINFGIKKSY